MALGTREQKGEALLIGVNAIANILTTRIAQNEENKKELTITAKDSLADIVKMKVAVGNDIDIDYFKMVNDTYGHDVGDKVLKQFVNVIQKSSRKDDLLIRWGGEEFLLLTKVKSIDNAKKVLENIRNAISQASFEGIKHMTCSIGATNYKENENIEESFKRADDALYEAKNNGRNQVQIK